MLIPLNGKKHKKYQNVFDELKPFNILSIELDIKSVSGQVNIIDDILISPKKYFIGIEYQSNDYQIKTIGKKIENFLNIAHKISNIKEEKLYRICYESDLSYEPVNFKEFIGVEVDFKYINKVILKNMIKFTLPETKLICFKHKGKLFEGSKLNILDTYDYIYRYRLFSSEYKLKYNYLIESRKNWNNYSIFTNRR